MAGSRNNRRHLGNAITLLTPNVTATTDQLYQRDALQRHHVVLVRVAVLRGLSSRSAGTRDKQ